MTGPATAPELEPRKKSLYTASQWRLMWLRFRKHKLAMGGAIFLLLVYLVVAFAEFLAPFSPSAHNADYQHAPPQRVHLFEETSDGTRFNPHVKGFDYEVDDDTWRRTFSTNETEVYPIRFFVRGHEYKLFGLISTDIHLFGPVDPEAPMYLLGADRMGRDVLSRALYGTRISMSIGLIGVVLALVLGIILGGISGYFGGVIDSAIQRLIEFLRSIPEIPLWMALTAALRRMSIVASDQTHRIRMAFANGSCKLSVQTPDLGEAQEEVNVSYEGDPLEIGFNAEFLRDGLESVTDETVRLKLISPLRPGLLHGESDPIPVESSREMAELLKAEFHALPRCGHVPYVEAFDEFVGLVDGFLRAGS
jgi:ABC-type dipeptide/oligopeptide/nickel transport system permease subunit